MPMNGQEFELLKVRHGADLSQWPPTDAARARNFLDSAEGVAFARSDAALDALLATEVAVPGDTDAFLARLMDIPADVSAERQGRSKGLLARFFGNFSARSAFVSQAAVYVIVLGVGIAIGMQGEVPDTDMETLDLSEHLFASNADLYLEDE